MSEVTFWMLLKTGSKALMSSSRRAKWTSRHCSRRTQGTRAVYLLYLLCFTCAVYLLDLLCSRRTQGTRAVYLLYLLYSSSLHALHALHALLEQFTCFTCFTRAVYLLKRSAVGRSVLSFCSNSLLALLVPKYKYWHLMRCVPGAVSALSRPPKSPLFRR
jgi:hypothetical protein